MLKARIQMKRLDVYALRRVKGEPATPGLSRSTDECVGPYTDPTSPEAAGKPVCPFTVRLERIEAGSVTMIQFAEVLTTRGESLADRLIIDDTGLAGTYDVRLTTGLIRSPATSIGDGGWPSAVRRALKEQLGLELQKATLPIPVLRIEGARKPSED